MAEEPPAKPAWGRSRYEYEGVKVGPAIGIFLDWDFHPIFPMFATPRLGEFWAHLGTDTHPAGKPRIPGCRSATRWVEEGFDPTPAVRNGRKVKVVETNLPECDADILALEPDTPWKRVRKARVTNGRGLAAADGPSAPPTRR